MEPDRKPEIVDLARYKQAAEARAKHKAPPKSTPGPEPILGARPRAGLILGLILAVLAGFWLLSNLS